MKFFDEYKTFIKRGNVIDMAVGVIVGGAFTAIVTAMNNSILRPVVNWILALVLDADALSDLHTYLKVVRDAEGNLDMTQSIYMDWSALINAIIQFLLIALVLFTIVKIINGIRAGQEQWSEEIKKKRPTREDRREMKSLGIKRRDKAAVAAYYANKKAKAEAERLAKEQEAAEKARLDRLANPTVEDLLKQILGRMPG